MVVISGAHRDQVMEKKKSRQVTVGRRENETNYVHVVDDGANRNVQLS
jgi:hypothetical protein